MRFNSISAYQSYIHNSAELFDVSTIIHQTEVKKSEGQLCSY